MAELKNAKTHVAFVLDRSGSMKTLQKVAISGFNAQRETLLTERNTPNSPDMTMTVCLFSNTPEFTFILSDPNAVQDLNETLYRPNGGTALYDATMDTIACLERGTDPSDDYNSYLVVIISDGQENASLRTNRNDLAEKIQSLQGTGRWTFTYLASNQDLAKISQELNIPVGNMANYAATEPSTYDAFQLCSAKLGDYMQKSSAKNRNSRVYEGMVGGLMNCSHSTSTFYGESGITDVTKTVPRASEKESGHKP